MRQQGHRRNGSYVVGVMREIGSDKVCKHRTTLCSRRSQRSPLHVYRRHYAWERNQPSAPSNSACVCREASALRHVIVVFLCKTGDHLLQRAHRFHGGREMREYVLHCFDREYFCSVFISLFLLLALRASSFNIRLQ